MRHVASCAAFLFAAASALAQVGGTGFIEGTITDPSGAVVANAEIISQWISPFPCRPSIPANAELVNVPAGQNQGAARFEAVAEIAFF